MILTDRRQEIHDQKEAAVVRGYPDAEENEDKVERCGWRLGSDRGFTRQDRGCGVIALQDHRKSDIGVLCTTEAEK